MTHLLYVSIPILVATVLSVQVLDPNQDARRTMLQTHPSVFVVFNALYVLLAIVLGFHVRWLLQKIIWPNIQSTLWNVKRKR